MKITAITPAAAAANPSHPNHARWVKEQTLKQEIRHAQMLGLSSRHAETENSRQLERLAARAHKKRAPRRPTKVDAPEQLAKEGVTVRKAQRRRLAPMPPCRLCRRCVWCKRSLRMSQIATKAKQLDTKAVNLMLELTAVQMAASRGTDYRDAIGRELPFSRLRGHEVDRAVTQGIEWVCDRSVSFMGQWR